jgi:L-lactate dehydrogenase complex protein LldG
VAPDLSDGLVDAFLAALETRRASGEWVAQRQAGARAAARVAEWGAPRALLADEAWLDELGVPEALGGAGVEVVRWPPGRGWRELLGLEGPERACGVTVPARAVAERGTLLLEASRAHGRSIDTVSTFHLAVLPADRLVRTLREALDGSFESGTPASAVSLVSGPSRSSDIEKISTLGAHGALAEHVIVVERDSRGR